MRLNSAVMDPVGDRLSDRVAMEKGSKGPGEEGHRENWDCERKKTELTVGEVERSVYRLSGSCFPGVHRVQMMPFSVTRWVLAPPPHGPIHAAGKAVVRARESSRQSGIQPDICGGRWKWLSCVVALQAALPLF